jgi:hypothetical protein
MSQYVVRAVKGPDEELPELHIKEYDRRKAPRTMPRPPFLCGMFGSRGAGKTSLLVKLIRWYDSVRAFDRVVVFSPTHQKDPKWEALQNSGMYAKLELHAQFTFEKFAQVQREQEERLTRYDRYLFAREAYKKFNRTRGDLEKMTEDELLTLYEYDFSDPQQNHNEFEEGRPSILIAFDDHVGNRDVYRGDCKGPVAQFALLHRHFNCSICFMAQIYSCGIPNGIRNNLSLAIFFRNKSKQMKWEVSNDTSSFVEPEQFMDMWTYATESEDHACFMVTFDAERPEWRFRKNFNVLLLPQVTDFGAQNRDLGYGKDDEDDNIDCRDEQKRQR